MQPMNPDPMTLDGTSGRRSLALGVIATLFFGTMWVAAGLIFTELVVPRLLHERAHEEREVSSRIGLARALLLGPGRRVHMEHAVLGEGLYPQFARKREDLSRCYATSVFRPRRDRVRVEVELTVHPHPDPISVERLETNGGARFERCAREVVEAWVFDYPHVPREIRAVLALGDVDLRAE